MNQIYRFIKSIETLGSENSTKQYYQYNFVGSKKIAELFLKKYEFLKLKNKEKYIMNNFKFFCDNGGGMFSFSDNCCERDYFLYVIFDLSLADESFLIESHKTLRLCFNA